MKMLKLGAALRAAAGMAALVLLLVVQPNAYAAFCQWQGGATGNYAVPGNWTCGFVPTSADNVQISNASVTIASGVEHPVNLLSLSSATLVSSGAGGVVASNGGSLITSTISGAIVRFLGASVTVSGVTLNTNATDKAEIHIESGANMTGNITNAVDGRIRIWPGGSASMLCVTCGSLRVYGGGVMAVSGNSTYAEVLNEGELRIATGITLSMSTPSGFEQFAASAVLKGMGAGSTLANPTSGFTFSGGTIEGTLDIVTDSPSTGLVFNGATISPGGAGAIGTITISGGLQHSGGTLKLELAGPSSFDQLNITGPLTETTGGIEFPLLSYVPTNGAAHNVLGVGSHAGTYVGSVSSPMNFQAVLAYPTATQIAAVMFVSKTCVWNTISPQDSNWTNPNNWNFCAGNAPGQYDAAEFGGAGTINLPAGSFTVRNIYAGTSNLVGAGAASTTLTVTEAGAPAWASGSYGFTNLTLNINGNGNVFATSGTLTLTNAVMNIGANIQVLAGAHGGNDNIIVDGANARLNILANGQFSAIGNLTVSNGARVVISHSGTLSVDQAVTLSSGGQVENNGTHSSPTDVPGGGLTITGAGSEYRTLSQGSFQPIGDLTMSAGGKFVNQGSFYPVIDVVITGPFENEGIVSTRDASITISNGADFVITNAASEILLGYDFSVTTGGLSLTQGAVYFGETSGPNHLNASVITNSGAVLEPKADATLPLTLFIGGNYVQTAGGSVGAAWDGSGNASAIQVNGPMSLAGTLRISYGSPQPADGSQLTVMTSTGTRTGTFTSLVFPNGGGGTASFPGNSVQVTKAAAASVSISPTAYIYSPVEYGLFEDHTFTIDNNSGVASTGGNTSVGFTGTDIFDYKVQTDNCTGIVANGASCTVVVRFAPATAPINFKEAQFFITINGQTASASLGGNTVQRSTGGWIAFSSGSTGLSVNGPTTVGTTQGVGVTVRNVGNASVTVSSAVGTATFSSSGVGGCLAPLAPGGSCGATLNFSPVSVGAASGTFTVTAPTNTITRAATGTGTTVLLPTVTTTVSPTSIVLGGNSRATVTITNPNSGTSLNGVSVNSFLTVGQLSVASMPNVSTNCFDAEVAAFSGASSASVSGFSLAASGSCTFAYDFHAGNTTGTHSVGSNSISSNEVSGSFNGGFAPITVTSATPTVAPTSFAFGTVPVGGSADSATFTVYAGSGLAGLSISPAAPFSVVNSTCGSSLGAGLSCTFQIRFSPTVAGAQGGSLAVNHSMGTVGTINYSGTGVDAFVVTTTADAGVGSLRFAISHRNANCAGSQTISFNIAGMGPHTIQPASALPAITCANTTIDGYTQSGASPNTNATGGNNANLQIILNSSLQGSGSALALGGNAVSIKGLAIRSYPSFGVHVTGTNAVIVGNYIGTDPGGLTALGGAAYGVVIDSGATNAQVGDTSVMGTSPGDINLITANGAGQISIYTPQAFVHRNMLGSNRSGGSLSASPRGVFCGPGCSNVSIVGNRIRDITGSGIDVSATSNGVKISQNSIQSAGVRGINTNTTGNNGLQKASITSVTYSNVGVTSTVISGTYTALDATAHTLEVFDNGSPVQATATGVTFVGQFALSPGAAGLQPFSVTVNGADVKNLSVTVRRDSTGDTSEFSSRYLTPLSFAPAIAAFNTPVAVPQAQSVTVTNQAGAVVTITGLNVTGTGFTIPVGETCTTGVGPMLPTPGTCSLSVSYVSPSATTATGAATLAASQGGVSTTFSIALSATAFTPPATALTQSAASLNFGGALVASTTAGQTVTITNTGANPLIVSGTTVVGTNPSDFLHNASGCTGVSIAPGMNCLITVNFQPIVLGARTATLQITSNATGSPHLVTLSGTGLGTSGSPAALNFGTVAVTTASAPQTVTLSNSSGAPVSISSITTNTTSGAGAFGSGAASCGTSIPAMGTCTVPVTFSPPCCGLGATTGEFVATTSAGVVTIPLTGTAGTFSVTSSATSHNFGAVPSGQQSATFTFTLTNSGTGTARATNNVVLSGDNPTHFTIVSENCSTTSMAPSGGTCTVVMRFNPTAVAALTAVANVNFASTAIPLNLSGTGLAASAALTVTNTNDSGLGSLREAINYVNANCTGTPVIGFNIPGGGPHKIQPLTQLPDINCKDTTIDGYTQPGSSVNTAALPSNNAVIKIWLDGALQTGGYGLGFAYAFPVTGNQTVRGLSITRFGAGVRGYYDVRVNGNFIGVEPDGVTAGKNTEGVRAEYAGSGACCVKVGTSALADANMIAATNNGVAFVGNQNGVVEGNTFGYDKTGVRVPALASSVAVPGFLQSATQAAFYRIEGNFIAYATTAYSSQGGIFQARRNSVAQGSNVGGSGFYSNVELTEVIYDVTANTTRLRGNLNALSTDAHVIEVYRNPTPHGATQAETYVADISLTPSATGSMQFTQTISGQLENPTLVSTRMVQTPVAFPETAQPLGYRRPFTVSAAPTTFTAVAGGGVVSQTVMLTNSFGGPITFATTPATTTGTGYSITGGTCSGATILASGTCTVIVSFSSPTVVSNVPGTLDIFVDVPGQQDVSNGSVTVQTVYRTAMLANASAAPATTTTVSPGNLLFGSVTVGVNSTTLSFTINNTGANPLLVTAASLGGPHAADFSQMANSCVGFSVPSGMSCTMSYRFTPSIAGTRNASIFVTSNGGVPTLGLNGSGTAAVLTLSSSSLPFGSVPVATPAVTQFAVVTNNTAGPVTFSAGSFSGTNAADFSNVTNDCVTNSPVAVGASCAITFGFTPSAAGSRTATYTIASTASTNPAITLTGTGNAGTGPFAYITNDVSDNVSVVNVTTGAVVSTIAAGNGPYGVGVNPAGTRAYVTNYHDGSVSVIDTATNTVIATPTVGAQASMAAVNRAGTKVSVGSISGAVTSVIDTATNTVASTIVSGSADGVAVSPGGNRVYVTSNTGNTVKVYSTSTGALLSTITVNGALQPVMHPDGSKLYVTNYTGSMLSVVDTTTNTVSALVNLGSIQYGAALNPSGTRLYVSRHTANAVSVVDTVTNATLTNIPVTGTPLGLAVDASGSNLVVARRDDNKVSVYDTSNNTFLREVTVGTAPHAMGQFMQPAGMSVTTPSVTTTAMPPAVVGVAYSHTLAATGTGPYDWSISFGSLPAGLSLNQVTGVISGTPTTAGSFNFTVQASNGALSGVQPLIQAVSSAGLSAMPGSLTFPNTVVGGTSAVQNVTLTNNTGVAGGLTLSLPSNVQYQGDDCGGFAVGAMCTYQFRFAPTVAGALSGTITFTANAQTANVTFSGTAVTGVSANNTSLVFGSSNVGVAASNQSVTLTNNLGVGITITAGTMGGANASDFSIVTNGCLGPLAAGASCNISFGFTPSAAGTRTASFQVNSTASTNPSISLSGTGAASGIAPTIISGLIPQTAMVGVSYGHTFNASGTAPITWTLFSGVLPPGLTLSTAGALTGTPTAPGTYSFTVRATNGAGVANQSGAILVTTPLVSNLLATPGALSFGNQNTRVTSEARTVTITSTGNGPATIERITTEGDFGFSSRCPGVLNASSSCEITVTFTPLVAGPAVGRLSVLMPSGQGASVALSGSGVDVPRPNIAVAPAVMGFADQAVGSRSAAQTMTISNSGLATLQLRGLAFTGSGFGRDGGTCGGSVAPGQSCTVLVVFAPSTAGANNGTLEITHNATPTGESGTATVTFFGNATPRREPIIRVSGNLSFGDVVIGQQSAAQTVTISNAGTADLTIGGLGVSPAANTGAGEFSISGSCGTLIPGGICSLLARFQPANPAGAKSATLRVSSNATNESAGVVGLAGNALPRPTPALRLSTNSLGFGNVQFGGASPLPQVVTVTNSGTDTLNVTGVSLTGNGYSVVNGCGTVAVNASCTITVSFNPPGLGDASGSITITSNAPGSPHTVSLTASSCRILPPNAARVAVVRECGAN
jgi:YVTN family beta-propeller protein